MSSKKEDTMRIRVDEERLNDSNSLDVSFLEGKAKEKACRDDRIREKILEEKNSSVSFYVVIKVIFYVLLVIGLLLLGYFFYTRSGPFHKVEYRVESQEKKIEKVSIDDNYLFIGDFYMESMNFDTFHYPFVKKSSEDMTTSYILENISDTIYVYNPTVVVLQTGIQELLEGEEINGIIERFETIVRDIQKNRPLARIYIESLYPVDVQNSNYPENFRKINPELIQRFNEQLKEKMNLLNVSYIDLYEELSDSGVLKSFYTEDGLHLNSTGYERIWKVLNRTILELE